MSVDDHTAVSQVHNYPSSPWKVESISEATRSYNSDTVDRAVCPTMVKTNGQHETSYMYNSCSEAVTGRLRASIFVLSCTVCMPMRVIENHVHYVMKINQAFPIFLVFVEVRGYCATFFSKAG